MNEQVPADQSDTPRTDAETFDSTVLGNDSIVNANFARQLERELAAMTTLSRGAVTKATDLRASLRREENARKVLADENNRLRADLTMYRAAHTITRGVKP